LHQNLKILPTRLRLIVNDETPTAQLVESRLHALRQIYAISFLVDAGREANIAKALDDSISYDLENLIEAADRLLIVSASQGSFWVTVTAAMGAPFKSLMNIVHLFYEEGRHAALELAKARTELAKLDVDKKRLDIRTQKVKAMIDLYNKIEKIKDPTVKNQIKAVLSENIIASGNTPPSLPPDDNNVSVTVVLP
jgi:hypothetical protein